MAGAAPKAAVAVARTSAERELLHVADDFERAAGIRVVIRGEYFFSTLARDEIAQLFSRIGHARDAEEVALLAYAVARGGLQLRGIYDVAGARVGEMLFRGAVTTFAGDRFFCCGKYWRAIFV